MFNALGSLLPHSIASHGLHKRVGTATLAQQVHALVEARWGKEAAGLIRVRNVEAGILVVEVQSSALAHELTLQADDMLRHVTIPGHMMQLTRIRAVVR